MRSFTRLISLIAPLLEVLAFWGGIVVAEWRYPAEFDWRYMTLSTLISPRRNPHGYLWAATGLVISALLALWWAIALAWTWGRSDAEKPRGVRLLAWGSVCMVCSVVLPWRLPRQPKEHEIFTLFAFVGLCLGMIRLAFHTIERVIPVWMNGSGKHIRLYSTVLAGVAVVPIFLAGLAEAYVFYVLPQLHWVNLAWRAQGVPMYLSFAFWEWITCAVLSAYVILLSLANQYGNYRDAHHPNPQAEGKCYARAAQEMARWPRINR